MPGNDVRGKDVPAAGMGRDVPGDDMPGADTTDSAGAATPGAVGLRDDGPPGNGYFLRHRVASDPPTASVLTVLAPVPPTPAPLNSMTAADAVSHTEWCAAPPQTRADALNRRDAHLWQQAMDEELASLRAAHAWELLALPAGATTTGGRWVFDHKRDANGTVTRYEARYVAQGYTQRAGVDYMDVWAPCPAHATVRAVMVMVAADDPELHVIDIRTAYLNASMDMDVYGQQPEGFEVGASGTVARVLHALYVCKQAERLWGNPCHMKLTDVGAERSTADPTMYVWRHAVHGPIFILVHEDDMAVAAKKLAGVSAAKDVVLSTYKGRDLGASDTLLGMRVCRDRAAGTLSLSCPGVTVALLQQFGMSDSRPNKLPLATKDSLGQTGQQRLLDTTPYAELVGSILYLSITTRPDLAYASGLLARYMSNLEEQHWTAAKGVLRYLSGTVKHGLCYGGSEARWRGRR